MSEARAQATDGRTASQRTLREVDRAIGELRRGAPVLLSGENGQSALIAAAEGLWDQGLAAFRAAPGDAEFIVLTMRRAAALGIDAAAARLETGGAIAVPLLDRPAARVLELTDPTVAAARPLDRPERGEAPAGLDTAAVDLMKIARLLPAALLKTLSAEDLEILEARDLLTVGTDSIRQYRLAEANTLRRVASARVPLEGAEEARIEAFRPDDGGVEHLAIVIGEPDPAEPVLVRLHSECFTGDLLGSLRCDCGEQLRGAIRAISALGSGVLLYLAQEGRGIGLVNKLRAYELQDRGADTLEANEQLGFDADERIYLPAAAMLRDLGMTRVNLLTNNPDKLRALERCGIEVAARVPHRFPSNRHNADYLYAKATRLGHLD